MPAENFFLEQSSSCYSVWHFRSNKELLMLISHAASSVKMLFLKLLLFLVLFQIVCGSSQNINPTSSSIALSSSSSSSSSTLSWSPSHSSSLPELTPSWTFVSRSLPSMFTSGPVNPTSYLETLRTTLPKVTSLSPHSSAIWPTSSFVAVTSSVCGGTMNKTTGIIEEAGRPSNYRSCNWMIYSPVEDSIILLVFEQYKVNCWNSWISIRTWRQSKDFCQEWSPFAILALDRYVTVTLFSSSSYFRLKAYYFALHNATSESPHQHKWNVTVCNVSSTAVNVTWSRLNIYKSNSTYIYGYVANVHVLRNGTGSILLLNVTSSPSSNTSSSFLSAVVGGLIPYTKYRVTVVALVRDRMRDAISSKSSPINDIQTQESVPDRVPWLYVSNRGVGRLEIVWGPISSEDAHGLLLGYTVHYRIYNSYQSFTKFSVNASTRELNITGLMEATRYEIKVAGRTSVGEGADRSTNAETECGQNFDKPSGQFSVGRAYTYYSRDCNWLIQWPDVNSSILLVFEEFDGCRSYTQIRSSQQRKWLTCNQNVPLAVLVLDNYVEVNLRVDSFNTGLKVHYFLMNNFDSSGLHQSEWNFTVVSVSSTEVDVSWSRLNTNNPNTSYIYGYVAALHMLRNGSGDILFLNMTNSPSSNASSSFLSTVVSGLRPYTKYGVKVVALVRDRMSGVVSSKSSPTNDIQTMESVPDRVPWLSVGNRGVGRLEVLWGPISGEDAHGILLGYTVHYRIYNSYQSYTNFSVNASTRELNITGLMEATRYEIKVAGRTSVGEGAERSTNAETECGQKFDEPSGQFSVRSAYSYYSRYCNWLIQSPVANSSILLVFEELHDCWSYTKIRSSRQREWLSCNQKVPFAVLVLENYVEVNLRVYRSNSRLKVHYFLMNNSDSSGLHQREWNVTVVSVSSTEVNVSWSLLITYNTNSSYIYGYVAALHKLRNGAGDIIVLNVTNSFAWNASSPFFSTMASSLRPYTKYEVKVVALVRDRVTGVISLKSSAINEIQTLEGVPRAVPWLYVRNRGTNTLEIVWGSISSENAHGILLGYTVHYRIYNSYESFTNVSVNASAQVLNITGLKEATRYQIKVTGRTSVGEGAERYTDAQTECGQNFDEPSGQFGVNGAYSRSCNWIIQSQFVNSSIHVLLVFEELSGCRDVGIRSSQQTKYQSCYQRPPFAILVLDSYVLVSLSWYSYRTRMKVHYLMMNNSRPDALRQREWNVTVLGVSSRAVSMSWLRLNDYDSNASYIYGYIATLYLLRHGTGDILLLKVENTPSSNTSFRKVVGGLRPYTKYGVKVVALVRDRMTGVISPESSSINEVQTLESVPDAVPWLYVHKRGTNTLKILWGPISSEDAHGILLGYTVHYRIHYSYESFTNISVNARTQILNITGLKEATRYQIKVTGRTSVGEGAERYTYAETECGGIFDEPSGEISVNSAYSYPSRSCNWIIQSPLLNSSIHVLLVFEELYGCRWYGARVSSSQQSKYQSCYQRLPFAVFVLDSYVLISINWYRYRTRMKVHYFMMNNSRPDALRQREWNVTVVNVSSTAVNMSWLRLSDYDSNSSYIYGYVATLYVLRPGTGDILFLNVENTPSSNTSFRKVVSGLRPYTKYGVKIVALVRDRMTGVISPESSAINEVQTLESVPSAVPWLYVRNRDINTLEIVWGPISSEDAHGILLGYTVRYRIYNSYESFTNLSVNVTTQASNITDLKEGTGYQIVVTGHTSVGEGAERSTYAVTACGQNFDMPSGEFSASNLQWHHSRHCHWMIQSPFINSSILLVFEEYRHRNCWSVTEVRSTREDKRLDCHSYKRTPFAVLVLDGFIRISSYLDSYGSRLKVHYFIINNSRSDALYQRGWNVTVANVTSKAIHISWLPLSTNSSNSSYIYGYLVVLFKLLNGTGDIHLLDVEHAASSSTLVSGLRPYTKYHLRAISLLRDRVSGKMSLKTSESTEIQTAEGVPLREPSFKSVLAWDHQSIFVSWYALSRKDTGGILRGYRVHCSNYWNYHSQNVTVGPEQLQVLLTDLKPDTYYEIYVAAFTSKGEGPKNWILIKTPCGALISGHIGKITSPGFPYYIRWSDCTWNYTAPDNNSVILLTFVHFNLPFTWNCRRFYLEITKGQDVERVCGRRTGLTVVWEGPSLHLRYHSRRWTSSAAGFKAQYHILNKSLTEAPLIRGWNITAESISSTTVLVTWPNETLAISSKDLYGFIVACTATEIRDALRLAAANSSSLNTMVQRLVPYTEYRVQVIVLSKGHDQSNGSISMGSSSVVVLRTKEDVPSKPPSNISGHGTNSTTIRVRWSPINEADIRGELQGYLVQYKKAWTQDSYYNMSVGPLVSSVLLKGLRVLTLYRIYLAGFTRVGVGVQSRPHFVKTGCLFFVPSDVTDFASPNYPSNYPSNANCTWVIGQGMELKKTKIILFFDYLHTEGFGAPCSSDYVQVRDKSQSIDWKFCGKQPPFAVTLTESSFTVRLYSDNGIEEKGFYARYLLVKQEIDLDIAKKEENTNSASALLEWKKTQNVGELKGYIVLYKLSQSSTYWNVIRINGTQVSLKNIQPRKEYTVRVLLLAKSNVTYISQTFTLETGVAQTTGEPTNTPSPTTEGPMQLMYPYGPSAGDSEVPNTYEYSWQCLKIDIPDDGMQFFGKRHYKVHICRNGLLQFDSQWLPWWPYNFGERWWLKKKAMLAPYWSLTDTDDSFVIQGFSKVYYHVYSDSDPSSTPMLKRASSDTKRLLSTPLPTAFKASWVLVVTWKNLRPYQYPASMANQGNTFQLVLITNGVYSFTMYNYPSNGLQWSAPTQRMYYQYYSNSRGLPVVGWNAGDNGERKYNMPRSGTVNIETIDGIRGNADMVGKWFFRLEESLGKLNARQECIDWFKAQPDPRLYTEYLEPCPCILRQAWWDERFTVNWRDWPRMCGYAQFPSPDGWGQECCYSTNWQSWGALLVGNPGGGSAHRYHKLTEELRDKHDSSDVQGYQKCCVNSDFCDLYYRRRPSDDCGDYVVPEWSWLWGDPHFVTLDGKNYTFNGLGEYIMADARNGSFKLQARTKLAKGDGTATVFSAAAAMEGNSSVVQVELDDAGISVMIDGVSFDYTSLSNESVTLNGSVAVAKPDNNSFLMVFPSGISVTTKAVSGALSIILAAPKSFKNQTKGLLGTWNDNPEDDFFTPNGTILPSSASSKDIHYNFGLLWQVDNKSTLFTYKPGESLKTFANTSFVPMFLEDLSFPNDTLRKQAEEACQGDRNCLFDSASTKDVSMGASTKALSSTLEKESSSLKNYPPRFVTKLTLVNVTVNQIVSVTVVAEDPNNDTLLFSVFGVLPRAAILQNTSNSVSVTWNGTNEEIELEFVVTDDQGATAFLRPIINLCACRNNGICLQSASTKNSTHESNKMNVLGCGCLNGYTGTFCESDLDACEANLNPCYPGVKCIDLPPPANISGYKCGPCPNGFTGDGSKCRDFDECLYGSNGGCSQVCINTPGSFTCDCRPGYLLNVDQKKCDDVNECIPVSDCMHKCENTNGGYRCSCDNFFKVDPSNPKNCLPDSPCQKGKHSCQHICYYGSNKIQQCACRRGYLLGGDGNTCKDIDECATNEDRCNHKCSNTEGSYSCSCVDGFRLDTDNVTCIDIDECLEWTFKCQDSSQRCKNTQGSYKCVCEEGLYWIDNACKGLDKNEKPPPAPPAPTPRIPSLIEKRQAIIIAFRGLNISQWTLPVEQVFKGAVADSVTTFCGESRDCMTKKLRKRRALDYVLFTSDQVHLLPGYPEETTYLFQIRVAIYVQFPPGVAVNSRSALDKNILLTVINTSREKLEKALNVTVVSLTIAFLDPSTESSFTETPKVNVKEIPKRYFIIGGATAGAILIIILCVLGCRKNCTSKQVLKATTVAYNKDDGVELHRVKGRFDDNLEEEKCYTNEQALDTDNEAI